MRRDKTRPSLIETARLISPLLDPGSSFGLPLVLTVNTAAGGYDGTQPVIRVTDEATGDDHFVLTAAGWLGVGNALYVNSNINLVGDRTIVAGDVSISMNDTVDIISADVVSLRVRRYSDTRYSLNITPTATEVTLTSYDNTGAINRPMVYAASSHTFSGGNINLVGNRSIVEGDNAIGINDTNNIIFVDTASFRVRRYDATRYRLGINPTSTDVTLTAYDDTGATTIPMVYSASSHTLSGGDVEIGQELGIGVAPGGLPIHISKNTNEMIRMTGSGTANNPFISFYADGTRKGFIQGHSNNNLYVAAPLGSMILGTDTAGGNSARITIAGGGAITIHSAITLQSAVTVDADMTITTSGNQGDRFLMTNSNVSGGSVFYDFNQTDRDAGSTGAFELGFYRNATNITQIRMSKEVFEVIIQSGGTYRFPLEVRAQQVILAELPTSNPGIVGALYRSGGTMLIST